MAILKNAGEVALEAGNSPRMIFEHYRELATGEEAENWFASRPTASRKSQLSEWTAALPANSEEKDARVRKIKRSRNKS